MRLWILPMLLAMFGCGQDTRPGQYEYCLTVKNNIGEDIRWVKIRSRDKFIGSFGILGTNYRATSCGLKYPLKDNVLMEYATAKDIDAFAEKNKGLTDQDLDLKKSEIVKEAWLDIADFDSKEYWGKTFVVTLISDNILKLSHFGMSEPDLNYLLEDSHQ